jgi:hypothetical protein
MKNEQGFLLAIRSHLSRNFCLNSKFCRGLGSGIGCFLVTLFKTARKDFVANE